VKLPKVDQAIPEVLDLIIALVVVLIVVPEVVLVVDHIVDQAVVQGQEVTNLVVVLEVVPDREVMNLVAVLEVAQGQEVTNQVVVQVQKVMYRVLRLQQTAELTLVKFQLAKKKVKSPIHQSLVIINQVKYQQ